MSQSIPRVFISYSHDSVEHQAFVLQLANRLRSDGLDCQLDQYINGSPPEGWQRWMEEQIELADFVLLICTETYYRRYRGKETQGGYGVNFEGPVLPEYARFEDIPLPLRQYTVFRLMTDYEALYRVVTKQPAVRVPEVLVAGDRITHTVPSKSC